jgi:hypothetical protein
VTWFYVDDKFGESTKVKSIPRGQRMAAIGLWTMAGQWAAGQLKDGNVPTYMVEELGGSERLANILVTSGLWEKTDDGYVFHDWADWQQTREQVEKKRADARSRMAKLRGSSGEVRANTSVGSGEVRDVFATPIPSLPIPNPKKTSTTADLTSSDFAKWYATYPKKVAKPAAQKAYAKARKNVDAATLLAAASVMAQAYATDQTYCPNPATWLNQERWTDEVAIPRQLRVVNDGRPEGW